MYSWKEKLIDWINQRGEWTRIGVAVGIALIITAIILAVAMPRKGAVNTNAVDIGELQGDVGTVISALGTKASKADLEELTNDVVGQAGDISSLGIRANNAETRLNTLENDMAELTCSPPEAYLTGTFGSYTLHAKSSEAGNFTANVHLSYLALITVSNTTAYDETLGAFYDGINFTTLVPAYIPVVTFNGTAWGISEVWFNIGKFSIAADTETTIPVTCVGLNSTWVPSFAYVEVYRI